MKIARIVTAALTLVAALAGAARAEADTLGGWKFSVAPYMWLSEVDADVRRGDQEVSSTVDFDDIFELLFDGDLFGGAGHFEAQYEDRFSILLDVVGTTVDPGKTGRAGAERSLENALFIIETGGTYRVWDHELGPRSRVAFEPLVGARYVYSWNQFTIETPGVIGGSREIERDVDEDFAEPFLGGRFLLTFTPELSMVFRGDTGGFGAGSDLSYQLIGTLLYRLPWQTGRIAYDGALGYRLLDFDWEEGSRELDLQFRGPVMGLVARF